MTDRCELCGEPLLPDLQRYRNGWNARRRGEPFANGTTQAWWDGWRDSDHEIIAERVRKLPPLDPKRRQAMRDADKT